MVSRESRVLVVAMGIVLAIVVGLDVLTAALGLPQWSSPLFGFLLVVGLGVAAPQLYLADTDSSRSPVTRLRITVFLTVVFALFFVGGASGLERLSIWAITGLTVVGWFAYEFHIAYQAAREREPADTADRVD